ncbi:hypothetical protein VQ02_28860 [Methylobacterium variabile]|jgi:predicted Zn finger-like uncharacterized protein|uniref:Zinc finger/thioredoxin putative domain-containing protein n=1 Tax=Methylobacterium variabile TaxID=298794 RepID=A0A0J6UUN2_9HYPH|nr:zinc-ribbon domain-containing protein [Methylobacterium variabile]KMO29921.1 hypothetical protein VQ02_28860 [Methylobacterium variabile]
MLIVCPSCASEYTLDPERIGPGGRTVRCAACREPWFVPPPAAEAAGGPALSPPGEAVFTAAAGPAGAPSRRAGPRGRTAEGGAAGPRRRLVAAAAAVAACGAVMAALLPAGRTALVRALPQTARLYAAVGLPVNLRGLAFRDIAAYQVPDASGGRLVVEGDVVSASARTVPVPPLSLEVRDEHGQVVYRWTAEAPRARLEPEESARFRAELAGPPARGRAVLVRFAAVDSGDSAVSLKAPMNAHDRDR